MSDKRERALKVLNWLQTSTFQEWHDNDFEEYISGDEGAPTKEDILKEIEFWVG